MCVTTRINPIANKTCGKPQFKKIAKNLGLTHIIGMQSEKPYSHNGGLQWLTIGLVSKPQPQGADHATWRQWSSFLPRLPRVLVFCGPETVPYTWPCRTTPIHPPTACLIAIPMLYRHPHALPSTYPKPPHVLCN